MRNYNLPFILIFLFLSISISLSAAEDDGATTDSGPGDGSVENPAKAGFSKIFPFGDSYTDPGNCKILGGLQSFVGTLLNKIHNRALLTTLLPDLPGNGLCNGKLVIDYLSESLDIPPIPAFKNITADFSNGANFAIAGSTALTSKFYDGLKDVQTLMFKGKPQSIQTQIDWFNEFAQKMQEKVTQRIGNRKLRSVIGDTVEGVVGGIAGDPAAAAGDPAAAAGESGVAVAAASDGQPFGDDTLFWIGELGGNDYARIFGTPVSGKFLANETVAHVDSLIQNLIGKGAKYMVIQGLPPLGCLPSHLAMSPPNDRDQYGCAKITNHFVQEHNSLLQKKVEQLQAANGDKCTIMFADYWKAFITILQDPNKFGFTEPFKACCGAIGQNLFNFKLDLLCGALGTQTCEDPENYIHWDGVHFTEAMHGRLADMFFHQQGFVTPDFDGILEQRAAKINQANSAQAAASASKGGDQASASANGDQASASASAAVQA